MMRGEARGGHEGGVQGSTLNLAPSPGTSEVRHLTVTVPLRAAKEEWPGSMKL